MAVPELYHGLLYILHVRFGPFFCFEAESNFFPRFVCRFFLFHLFESPKFLLSRGRQREAVTVVHALAYNNKTKTWLTEDILNEIGGHHQETEAEKLTVLQIVKRQAEKFSTHRIKPLFAYKRLGINTALLWGMWAAIGMGYPLFNVCSLPFPLFCDRLLTHSNRPFYPSI